MPSRTNAAGLPVFAAEHDPAKDRVLVREAVRERLPRGGAHDLGLEQQTTTRERGELAGDGLGARERAPVVDDLGEHAEPQRLVRTDGTRRERQRPRDAVPDRRPERREAAGGAELDLRHREGRAPPRDPDVAGEEEREPAAEGPAFDRSHERLRKGGERIEEDGRGVDDLAPIGGVAAEAAHVHTGAEIGRRAGQDGTGEPVIGRDRRQQLGEAAAHREAERVPLRAARERDDRVAVAARELELGGARHRAHRRAEDAGSSIARLARTPPAALGRAVRMPATRRWLAALAMGFLTVVLAWAIIAVGLAARLAPLLTPFSHPMLVQTFEAAIAPDAEFRPLRITVSALADDDDAIRATDGSFVLERSLRTMTRGPTAPLDFTMSEPPTVAAVLEWLGDFGVDARADPAHAAAREALAVVAAAARARTAAALHAAPAAVDPTLRADEAVRIAPRAPAWVALALAVALILAGAVPVLLGFLRAAGRC